LNWGLQPRQTVPGVAEFLAPNPSPRSTVPYATRLACFVAIRRWLAGDGA
ncbi:MAG: 5-formyltetrahydrofolate cyclo-ligase, partial [Clostridia bacterium]|nr:5-formyltetrahydrofolate cyclo-ligase [Clostridia bacterium]